MLYDRKIKTKIKEDLKKRFQKKSKSPKNTKKKLKESKSEQHTPRKATTTNFHELAKTVRDNYWFDKNDLFPDDNSEK